MEAGSLKFGTHYVMMYTKHVPKTIMWFCGYSCDCAC